MDYGQLAQLMQPQMMPNAPVGAGGMAGQMYYQDKARQDQALEGAGGLAQLNAIMQMMDAQEKAAGQPGRMADINTNTALSQGRNQTLPNLLSIQKNEAETKDLGSQQTRREAILNQVNPYANLWSEAKDDDSKRAVLDMMKSSGVTKIGSRNIDEIELPMMDKLMGMARSKQINTPAQVGKERVETLKGDNSYSREVLKQQGAIERAQIRAAAAKYHDDNLAKNATVSKKWEEEYYKKVAAGENTPRDDEIYRIMMINKNSVAAARAGNQAPTIDSSKMGGILKPPVTPGVASMPKGQAKSAEEEASPTSKEADEGYKVDLSKMTVSKGGKTQRILQKKVVDGKTLYRLEDGTIISAQ